MNWRVTDILTVKDVSFSFGDKAVFKQCITRSAKKEKSSLF